MRCPRKIQFQLPWQVGCARGLGPARFGRRRRCEVRRRHLMKSPTAAPAMVPAGLDRPSLTAVDASASPAAPSKAGKSLHFHPQCMVDGHGEGAVMVHLPHLSEEIRSVIRTPLQDVVLPLVDHLVRYCTDEFVLAEWRARHQGRQQGKRKTDFPFGGLGRRILAPR